MAVDVIIDHSRGYYSCVSYRSGQKSL